MACLNAEFVTAQFVIPVCPYIFLIMIVTLSLKMSVFCGGSRTHQVSHFSCLVGTIF